MVGVGSMFSRELNYGGFVSVGTVDWPGRAVCTVFFRGCPLNCWYCHNKKIRRGKEYVPIDYVEKKIRSSKILITGVVFSGGEATCQIENLKHLIEFSKGEGLYTALQTCGYFPCVFEDLVKSGLFKVSLDIKASIQNYAATTGVAFSGKRAYESLKVCSDLFDSLMLPKFEVVTTVFNNNIEDVYSINEFIRSYSDNVPHILQQGIVNKTPEVSITDLYKVAKELRGPIKLRTAVSCEQTV